MGSALKFLFILTLAYVLIEKPYAKYFSNLPKEMADINNPSHQGSSQKIREDSSFYYVSREEMNAISEAIFRNMENGTPGDIRLSDGSVIKVSYTHEGTCPRTGRPNYSAKTVKPTIVR